MDEARLSGPCNLWRGNLDAKGYPLGYVYGPGGERKRRRMHRHFYEEAKGALPAGQHLHHLCGRPACCNPDHLEPITPGEHLLRHDTFQRRNSLKTHCPQGHEYTEENTYRKEAGHAGRECRICRRAWRRAAKKRGRENGE